MQNVFKRWLQSIDSYDEIDKLRQTLMMEQFLQTVSIDLNIWLVDQKPETVDETSRLADQYVALRKRATSTQQSSTQLKVTRDMLTCVLYKCVTLYSVLCTVVHCLRVTIVV